MILNREQQAMLDGEYGEGSSYAIKIQLALGEAFDAPRMVPITRAHVALSNQEADLWFAEKMLAGGAKCRVAPTVNPGFCYSYFTDPRREHPVDAKFADLRLRTHNAYKGLGAILSYNCTPYVASNVPNFGEICAFSESSATPYVNSVWGPVPTARVQTALYAPPSPAMCLSTDFCWMKIGGAASWFMWKRT